MTSWVSALVAPGGSLARRGSSHCPRRSLRLIAVASPLLLGYIQLLQQCLWHVTRPDSARWYLVCGCAELYGALRKQPVVREFEARVFSFLAPLWERLRCDLQL